MIRTAFLGLAAGVSALAAAQAGDAPKPVAELLARIPAETSATIILRAGAAAAEAAAKADKRLAGASPSLWAVLTDVFPDPKALDSDAPAALLHHEASDGNVRRVRLVKVRAGADPFAGAKRRPADGWQVVSLPAERTVYAAEEGGYLAVADGKGDADWFAAAKSRLMPGMPAEQAAAVAGADVTIRVAAGKADVGVADALRLLRVLPLTDFARRGAEHLESLAGPLRSATVNLSFGEAGVRAVAFVEFPPDGRAGRWIAAVDPPRGGHFDGIAVGEPALLAALELSPKAGLIGLEGAVERATDALRREVADLPADFPAKFLAAARQTVEGVRGFGLAVGLPAGAPGVVGVQGYVDTVPGADFRKVAADLAPILNQMLAAAGRRVSLPMEFRRTADVRTIAGKPVDSLEIGPTGDGIAANTVRALFQAVLGPEGLRFLSAQLSPERTAVVLSGNAALLEKTLAGKGGLAPESAAAKRLAVLPKDRHATLLISPGRLMFLGRRIQQNALRLPEWKPTGFIAAGVRFSGAGARLDLDVPWPEAEALAQWMAAK